jgi:hypothetical protein
VYSSDSMCVSRSGFLIPPSCEQTILVPSSK